MQQITRDSSNTSAIVKTLGLNEEQIDGVLIPPEHGDAPHTGSGTGWEKPRFEPRLQVLIAALNNHGVFADDCIAHTGICLSSQLRKTSYTLIEIPRFKREVLVCNQVGESTFVSEKPLGIATYLRSTKSELEQMHGVTQVICRDLEQWAQDVCGLLLPEEHLQRDARTDIRRFVAIREEIRRCYSADQWMSIPPTQRKNLKILGLGIKALVSALSIEGNPYTWKMHVDIGAAVYGEGNPAIAEAQRVLRERGRLGDDPQRWKETVRQSISAEQWVAISYRDRQKVRIAGKGLLGIARILNVEGDTLSNRENFFILGAAVYGEDDQMIAAALEKIQMERNTDREVWREHIKEVIPTAADWVSLTQDQRLKIRILGKGLAAIGTMFGIEGLATADTAIHIRLGAAIYGEQDPKIADMTAKIEKERQQRDDFAEDPERCKAAIKAFIPTAAQWLGLSMQERKVFRIAGYGLQAIAKEFAGMEGKPTSTREAFVDLGAWIYGKDDTVIAEALKQMCASHEQRDQLGNDPERWREAVRQMFPDGEAWMSMTQKQKKNLSIGARGLRGLASIFGVEGKPMQHTSAFVELGAAIYGKNDPVISKELDRLGLLQDPERLRQEIRNVIPTAAQWVGLSGDERKKLKVHAMGMHALAHALGISGDPAYRDVHVQFGAAIYGENDPAIVNEMSTIGRNAQKRSELGEDPVLWRITLKETVPTAGDWLSIVIAQRHTIKIAGKGLHALAHIFGIQGNPYNNDIYLALAAAIYGKDDALIVQTTDARTTATDADHLREEILKMFPTGKAWISLNQDERGALKILGQGLTAIASIFGLEEKNAIATRSGHVILGAAIYGEDDSAIAEAIAGLQMRTDPQQLRTALRQIIPMSTEWLALSQRQRVKLKVGEIGIQAIATILGVEDDPANTPGHVKLGAAIYGEDDPHIHDALASLELTMDPAKMREAVLAAIPNATAWLGLTQAEKLKLKIRGKGVRAIATIMGIEEEAQHTVGYLRLAAVIYGENDSAVLAATNAFDAARLVKGELGQDPRRWREEIRKCIPTGKDWLSIKSAQRSSVRIAGSGLMGLKMLFGIQGNPYRWDNYVQYGAAIYGEDDPSIAAALLTDGHPGEGPPSGE